jgi:quinol monooxygenase YgiN
MELFIFVRLHAREGGESTVEEALQEVVGASRREPGCIAIHAYRATRDARLFYIHSRWKDEAAFDVHAALSHTQHFIESVQPLLERPLEVTRTVQIA